MPVRRRSFGPDIVVKPSACVDDAVNAYLIDGKLPPRRTVCDTANPPAAIPTDPAPGVEDLIAEGLLRAVLPHGTSAPRSAPTAPPP